MSALAALQVRLGGDPGTYPAFQAVREELRKLNHPACPTVAWAEVERLCLALFQERGLDLQSLAAYALARSHGQGLAGVAEGLDLLQGLLGHQWAALWPADSVARGEVLGWWFGQLQPLLRGLPEGLIGPDLAGPDLAGPNLAGPDPAGSYLQRIDEHLAGIEQLLRAHLGASPAPLLALRRQVQGMTLRLPETPASPGAATTPVAPLYILHPPPQRGFWYGLASGMLLMAIVALLLGWR